MLFIGFIFILSALCKRLVWVCIVLLTGIASFLTVWSRNLMLGVSVRASAGNSSEREGGAERAHGQLLGICELSWGDWRDKDKGNGTESHRQKGRIMQGAFSCRGKAVGALCDPQWEGGWTWAPAWAGGPGVFQSNGATQHQVESFIRTKLESLLKESQIRDKEDPDSFTVRALLKATHQSFSVNLRQVRGLSLSHTDPGETAQSWGMDANSRDIKCRCACSGVSVTELWVTVALMDQKGSSWDICLFFLLVIYLSSLLICLWFFPNYCY